MEKKMTKQDMLDLYGSLYKDYTKKASTLNKRSVSLAESATSYKKQAEECKQKLEAWKSVEFTTGDNVMVDGTPTGRGDLYGTIESEANILGGTPYYIVSTVAGKFSVAQHFIHIIKQHK